MKSIISTLILVLIIGSTFAQDIPNYGMTKEQIELIKLSIDKGGRKRK